MTYAREEVRAIIASSLSWAGLTDDELAAAVVGANFDAKPRIRPENKSFKPARERALIAEDGTMHELTFQGLMHAARRLATDDEGGQP